jgi:hypothetical protein
MDAAPQKADASTASTGTVLWAEFRSFAAAHPTLTSLALMTLFIVPVREIVIPQLTGRVIDSIRTKSGRTGTMRAVWLVIAVLAIVQVVYMFDDRIEAWLRPTLQNFF